MPALLKQKKFEFVSQALPGDAFGVVNFKGSEGFSTCYQFEIMLVATDPEIDLTAVLQQPATFTILRDDGDIPFHGILSQFQQLHAVDKFVFYQAILVPKLWWLSLTHHNQIFLDKTVPQILEAVLKDGGLTGFDFELKLQNSYPSWEFICQYRESHLNFVSRWMEREGMYYYFEQTTAGEKVIITDTNLAHTAMPEGQTMYYSPPSGLDEKRREEVIHAFICKQNLLPGKLHVQDYNYRTPSVNLSAQAPVSAQGRGEVHIYGEHFRTLQEGSGLAKIRVQELQSQEKHFYGESTIPYLRPGYRFDLDRHYRDSFNQPYLTIEISHEGSQTGFLVSGIQKTLSETEKRTYYRNNFVTIPGDVQYRHPKKTVKPTFNGTINARIDAYGSGEYAQLDEYGRYKVVLPFDLSGRRDGKASHWMRMAQPYAGENQGMHFPLHKHTEVLLTFIEGDPDRPIIASAIPNPESPSPVSGETQMKSFIKSGRGPKTSSVGASIKNELFTFFTDNYIELDDEEGKERVQIHTPGDLWFESNLGYGEYHHKEKLAQCEQPEDISNRSSDVNEMLGYFGGKYNPSGMKACGKHSHFRVSNFDTFNTQEGNIYDFGGYWNYNLGNSYTENFMDQDSSVTLNAGHTYDKAAKGGPTPGSITCSKIGSLDDNTWIEKTIKGAAYEYTYQKKNLEVEVETQEETHTYGKATYEYGYTGEGLLTFEGESKGGVSKEKTYCHDSGTLLEDTTVKHKNSQTETTTTTHEKIIATETNNGDQVSSETNLGSKQSSEINIGTQTSSEINVAAIATSEINVAAKATSEINVGGFASSEINVGRFASAEINLGIFSSLELRLAVDTSIKLALAADIDIEFAPSGWIKIENGKLSADFFGLEVKSEEALKIEAETLKMENRVTKLESTPTTIINNTLSLTQVNAVMIQKNTLNLFI